LQAAKGLVLVVTCEQEGLDHLYVCAANQGYAGKE